MSDKLEGEHTRLPWKTDPNLDTLNSVEIWEGRIKKNYGGTEKRVAAFMSKIDAEFIVKACNSFYVSKELICDLIDILIFYIQKVDKLGSVELRGELESVLYKSKITIKKARSFYKE